MTVSLSLARRLASLVTPRIVGLLCLTGASGFLAAGGTSPVQAVGFLVSGPFVAGVLDSEVGTHIEMVLPGDGMSNVFGESSSDPKGVGNEREPPSEALE